MTSLNLAQNPQPGTGQPGAAGPAAAAKPAEPGAAAPAAVAQPQDDPGLEPAEPAAAPAAGVAEPAKPKVAEQKPFVTDPVDENLKRRRSDVVKNLRDNSFQAGQQQAFEEYYNKYAFPRWTQENYQNALPDFRKDLRVEAQAGKGGGPPHDRLIQLSLAYLTKLVKGHYHPAVRVNATLALGDLYAKEAQDVRTPPVPLPAALSLLLELVNSAEPTVLDAIRVAALVGLNSHAILGIADQQVVSQQVIPSMLKVATTKVAPGRSAEGHAWIRALACDVLGELRSPGQDGEVAKALAEIAGDSSASFITRSAASRALGKLNYRGVAVNATELASQVGKLALDALEAEADREIPDFEQLLAEKKGTAATMGMGMPGMEGMMMDPMMMGAPGMPGMGAPPKQEDELKELEKEHSLVLRRRLMDRMAAAISGVSGGADEQSKGIVAAAVEPQQKQFVDALAQKLDAVKNLCSNDDLGYEPLVSQLKEQAKQMRTAVDKPAAAGSNAGAPAPAT
ncbi:MAG: hypothetical protein GXY83_02280 [Rhodopirellula sp.]|nr:hypothetical protein [Rhodopirellula sp.]